MKKTISESKICHLWYICFHHSWANICALFAYLFFPLFLYAQGDQVAIQVPINQYGSTEGALLHLPDDYASTTHAYPLIVFFHGTGESGTDLSKIYNSSGAGGPAYFIAHNQWPSYFINPRDGQPYKFIVVSPQASSWSTDYKAVPFILAYLVKQYRIDTNRIYLTGLSAGGWTTWSYAAHYQVVPNYKPAAIVPMSMATVPGYPDAYYMAQDSLYAWGFGDPNGDIWGLRTMQGMDSINAYAPGHARFTAYSGGHCCWNRYYNPTYREVINGKSMNIYEWMLQYARGKIDSLPPAPNEPPVVKLASKQITITLPQDSLQLDGSGSYDPDGTITAYTWQQVNGPSQAQIITSTKAITWVDSLHVGTYHFSLTVTDNGNLSATDTLTVVVNPAPNQPPVVKLASKQITITLPQDSVQLDGSGSYDPDGTITHYLWAQLSGPNTANILSSTQANTWIKGLQAGNYAFTLTITDNGGLSTTDTLYVTVNAAPPSPPVIVLSQSNIVLTLPVDSVWLDASASYDSASHIIGYQWQLIRGDTTAQILSPNQARTLVRHLQAGNYAFTITVRNEAGLTSVDTVHVQVQNPPNQPPVAVIQIAADSVVLPMDSVFLDGGSSYDPEHGKLNYFWQQIDGPAPALIRNATQAQTWATQLIAGIYRFSLTVTDSVGATSQDSIIIRVIAPIVKHNKIILPVWKQLWYPNIDSQFNIQPGDTICIPAGDYPNLSIANLHGSPEAPVVIQNCGGVVRIGAHNTAGYGFLIQYSDYFELSGSGTPGIEYGFELTGTPAAEGGHQVQGLFLGYKVDHIDVHNIYVNHTSGTGIECLTRAICSDPSTWRQNYIMEDLKFHHIKMVGTGFEGFYIGRTADYQVDTGCPVDTLYNPLIKNIEIYDNVFDSTGNDAIQLALAYEGTNLIHDNIIHYPGMNGGYGQGMGILIGGNTRADVYNNIIDHAQNLPIQVLGSGLSRIYNNIISNSNTDGIQIGGGNTYIEPTAVWVFNNTFVNIQGNGIIVWGTTTDTVNRFYNNLMVNIQKALYDKPDSGFYIPPASSIGYQVKYDIKNNLLIQDINKAGFVNPSAGDYHLLPSSPAVDAGMDLRTYGIYSDFDGNTRPYGRAFDIGAYEYAPHPNQPPRAIASANIDTIQLPVDSVLLDGSQSVDSDGYISSYFWQLKQGPAGWKIDHASSSQTIVYFQRTGSYVFQLTVTDNAGASATDTVVIVVLPALNRPPIAVTNKSVTIYLPVDSAWLDGSASYDPDDSSSSNLHFRWSYVQGPSSYSIADSLSAQTWVNQLVVGQYIFKLQVVDHQGAIDSGYVTVNVNPSSSRAPHAYAGPDRTIQLPQDTVVLDASGSTDSLGEIISYRWQVLAGPVGSMAHIMDSSAVRTFLQNLIAGTYIVQLTVTDNSGAISSDQLRIVVLPYVNKPPVANAGADVVITLPDRTATLNGSASYDPDGHIVSYRWAYISGPNTFTIVGANTPKPILYGLVEGVYTFQLTVTDNDGAFATDLVHVTVQPEPNQPPIANIRGDTLVVFPMNSLELNGSYSYDPDGRIISYQWKQISGPIDIQVNGWNSPVLQLSQLDIGKYTFALTVTDDRGAVSTTQFSFTVTVSSSSSNSSLIAYPNPVHDILHVFFYNQQDGQFLIQIFSLDGKLMAAYQFSKAHTNSFNETIDVHQLPPGMYILQVGGLNNTSVQQKIVKL
ncbi:MAG: putative Ig domain-containing protein [Thermoflavifilum sp.]|nr:putative Ig domain-containing protein [Thermoflavifilum sp.]